MPQSISFINLLRAFAVILITHAHTEGVWPIDIHGGGALGNALFFVISGFLLHVNRESRFPKWYGKKLARLYIPLILVHMFLVFIHPARTDSILDWVGVGHYWFVPAIALIYIFIYVFLKYAGCRNYRGGVLVAIAVYALLYTYFYSTLDTFDADGHFMLRTSLGLIEMLAGAGMRMYYDKLSRIKYPLGKAFAACMLYSISMVGAKLSVGLFYRGQFLQHFSALLFAVYLFSWGAAHEEKIRKFMSETKMGRLAQEISTLSLEIYLVQLPLLGDFKKLMFPLNLVVIILLIGICAAVLHKLSNLVMRITGSHGFFAGGAGERWEKR